MYLKKITLQGFKSFADKTTLHFDSGITCIVGPNGCGKSNIADAFRWVLGEQSAKSMRGNKMPDVIFAGAANRKPLNFAEVSLTLTDIQGALPIDYEEVSITRRLHRSGESEYLLNGNTVRLKDLQALFLGSGVGRNTFSIFEQGKLDQIISYTPHERRYIFEEAAGILRFLQRKKEALKRLEQADLNLSRVKDIHLEVEKQIQTLEGQAKKARLYKEKKEELELLEKGSYLLRWQGLEKKQSDLQSKYASQQEKKKESLQEFRVIQEEVVEAKQRRHHHEKFLRNQSERLVMLRGQQEIQLHEEHSLRQRQQENQRREKKLKQEMEDLALARHTRQKTLSEISRKREILEAEWVEAESNWSCRQDRVKLQGKEVDRLRGELTLKEHAYVKSLQQNSQWQSELKQAEVRLENLNDRRSQLEERLAQMRIDSERLAELLKEKKNHLQQVSGLVDSHKDRLEHYEEELQRLQVEGGKRQQELEVVNKKFLEIKARQKVLIRMRDDFEGFSSGSKRLLQEGQSPESPFFQRIHPFYSYFTPKSDVVEALAVALRAYSQTLVVEKDQEARDLLSFAEELNLQDYSILCIEWIDKFKLPSYQIRRSLFGRVSPNRVARHFLSATETADLHQDLLASWVEGKCEEGWSMQGMFVDRRGVLFKVRPSENQVFARESELTALEEECVIQEDLLTECEQAMQRLQQRRTILQLERAESDKMLRRDEMKLVEVNFGLQKVISDQEKNKGELLRSEQDLISLKQNREEQEEIFNKLEKQFEGVKQEVIGLQQEKEILQQELDKQQGVLRIHEQEQKETGAHYRQLAEERQQMLHQNHLLEAKEQDHDKNVLRIEDELAELEETKGSLALKEKEIMKALTSVEGEIKELDAHYLETEKQGELLFKECEVKEEQLRSRQERLNDIERELAQIDIQIAHQRAISQTIMEELLERYSLTIEEAIKVLPMLDKSLDQVEKQIKLLRQALQGYGDVNLSAIEDLEKHQLRNSFLKQQMDDMLHSKEELLAIIRDLDGESHKLFKETFEQIRANFRKNFQILFQGGEADLQFTEEGNILEAGIEISAKPPGKQMRSITLLSGGEKCLTAVALLFAIFEVKPAPFCILDEIDAPLDDINVDRFLNVVKHFVDRCQFLIVTHNKRTMAIGDTIFGVSMEEKGVSKLLSLEFAHEDIPETALVS